MTDREQTGVIAQVVKKQEGQFLGKYKGKVIDNADERNRGRLLVEVPTVLGMGKPKWAPGLFPIGGNNTEASIFVPAIGSQVIVEFVEGAANSPIWTGTYFPDDAAEDGPFVPPETFDKDPSLLHLIRTAQGIELRLEDNRKEGDEAEQQIILRHPKETDFVIDKTGAVTISDREGGEVLLDPENKLLRLDSHGNGKIEITESGLTIEHGSTKIELNSSGVTVEGTTVELKSSDVKLGSQAVSSIINAEAFIQSVFMSHTHPTGVGPSGPPVPTGMPVNAVALNKVKGA